MGNKNPLISQGYEETEIGVHTVKSSTNLTKVFSVDGRSCAKNQKTKDLKITACGTTLSYDNGHFPPNTVYCSLPER